MPYAENTKVAPERSRAEIEQTLNRYGAEAFSYGYEGDRAIVAFRAHGRFVRFEIHTPPLDGFIRTKSRQVRTPVQRRAAQEQAVRQRWRALLLVVKAKLESVESGIETFEEAFLAHILLPDSTTVGQYLTPQLEQAYETGNMPSLLPAVAQLLPGGDDA